MHSDEKTIRAQNLCDLKNAQQQLIRRTEGSNACFESLLKLNRAASTMCLAPEMNEEDLAALGEVLSLQSILIQAAYSQHLLQSKH